MAAIPVRIVGTILTKAPKSGEDPSGKEQCEIHGLASIEGLEIGGGPIIPPPGGELPPGEPPHPAYPIWGPPGINFPDRPGYPPTVGGGPIVPPEGVPPDNKPIPGWEAKAGWSAETGWFVVIVPKEGTPVPTPSKK